MVSMKYPNRKPTAAEIRKEYPDTKEGRQRFNRDLRRGKGMVTRMTVEQVAGMKQRRYETRQRRRNESKNGPVKTYFDPSIMR